MLDVSKLDEKSIMTEAVFKEIYETEDPFIRSQELTALLVRAKELRAKGEVEKLYKAYEERERKKNRDITLVENWTNFSDCPYDRMKCGQWMADDTGVRLYNPDNGLEIVVCRHPIIPVRRLQNMQTDEEQIVIAFKRNAPWKELTVPKTTTTQASKICNLAAKSVLVTSENARLLVRYLSDVEAENEDAIPLVKSSSKLGWIGKTFLPYDKSIVFDGNAKFRELYDSIHPAGSRDVWYETVKSLRASGRLEIKLMLAASFASVILSAVGGLPFIVDLWGETGSGKTVALMVAASVWANPANRAYIKDYASTDVGLEALADMLNNLPVILDDTSKRSAFIERRFEEIIYNLCSGKGKTRSNKELGINRENTWETIILTNGEKPLTGYVTQGGAINRVLEVESTTDIFSDPQKTADTVKANYGHAGIDFVGALKQIGGDKVNRIQKEYQKEIMTDDKAQKQAISLSVILTADKIATDYLFRDGQYINLAEVKDLLVEKEELSDNERCYRYIMDKVNMNRNRFDARVNIEQWGKFDGEYVVFYKQALQDLCEAGGFSKQPFISWGAREGLVKKGKRGRNSESVRNKNTKKTDTGYWILMDGEESEKEQEGKEIADGFVSVPEEIQKELPFYTAN